jgi:hypothetical protein
VADGRAVGGTLGRGVTIEVVVENGLEGTVGAGADIEGAGGGGNKKPRPVRASRQVAERPWHS